MRAQLDVPPSSSFPFSKFRARWKAKRDTGSCGLLTSPGKPGVVLFEFLQLKFHLLNFEIISFRQKRNHSPTHPCKSEHGNYQQLRSLVSGMECGRRALQFKRLSWLTQTERRGFESPLCGFPGGPLLPGCSSFLSLLLFK